MITGNKLRQFNERSLEALGIYVYGLLDPQARRWIYIGKGGGSFEDGGGNLRVFDHFYETDRALKAAENSAIKLLGPKHRAIADVWARQQDVEIHVFRRLLASPDEAHHVEAAILAALNRSLHGTTQNANEGMRTERHGALHLHEIVEVGFPPVDPVFPATVVLLPIINGLKTRGAFTPQNVYEATRFAWVLADKHCARPGLIAVGYSNAISRGAFVGAKWRKEDDGRRSFDAPPSNWLGLDHELVQHDFSVVLATANLPRQNRALGVHFDGAGHFSFWLAGPASKTGVTFSCHDGKEVPTDRWHGSSLSTPAGTNSVREAPKATG
jgi:hypothetical protein